MANRSPRAPDLIGRRQLLLTAAAAIWRPGSVFAAVESQSVVQQDRVDTDSIDWLEFQTRMTALAKAHADNKVDQQSVVAAGMQYLKQLNIGTETFQQAVEDAFETGNRYWLWQRMIKQQSINGGILNINREQLVQLHDHPGATGLLRIIEGEAEVWQFDVVAQGRESKDGTGESRGVEELIRVSHAVLKPGDTAVLTPERGNIHALRALSKECKMLDFFIPPYQRNQRSWYEPLVDDWFDKEKIACRRVSQDAYLKA